MASFRRASEADAAAMARIRSSGIRRGGNRASPEEQLEALAPTDPDREANPDALFE
ncbi:MAG: hypothetical protein ACI91T_002432, partial [Natronomonas sp.]